MTDSKNCVELVRQAQLGDSASMHGLAKLVQGRVFAHTYRLTLDHHLAQDLTQETLLHMVKDLKDLKQPERFDAWLMQIVSHRVDGHFRDPRQKRSVQMSTIDSENLLHRSTGDHSDGLRNLLSKELSETIFEAIAGLQFRHRHVLVLRCFEQMSYADIAEIIGCSKLHVRVLFYRAKQAFKHYLACNGFGGEMILPSLVLFAKITAPSKAAAATTSVTASSLKVGLGGTVVGVAGTKLGVAVGTVITAAAITTGGVTVFNSQTAGSGYTASASGAATEVTEGVFEYPSALLDSYCPDNNGWKGSNAKGWSPATVVPRDVLVGRPASERTSVGLPKGHWVELKFRGRIIDGPGDDIILVEAGPSGERAEVFITDGAAQKYLLGVAGVANILDVEPTEIGFDISDISLPFVPCAVRIVGRKGGGEVPGFDLRSVRARVSP